MYWEEGPDAFLFFIIFSSLIVVAVNYKDTPLSWVWRWYSSLPSSPLTTLLSLNIVSWSWPDLYPLKYNKAILCAVAHTELASRGYQWQAPIPLFWWQTGENIWRENLGALCQVISLFFTLLLPMAVEFSIPECGWVSIDRVPVGFTWPNSITLRGFSVLGGVQH